jgi:hypothetical protein
MLSGIERGSHGRGTGASLAGRNRASAPRRPLHPPGPTGLAEFHSGATQERLGTSSLNSCTHFASSSGLEIVNPVTLPPGRAKLTTGPPPHLAEWLQCWPPRLPWLAEGSCRTTAVASRLPFLPHALWGNQRGQSRALAEMLCRTIGTARRVRPASGTETVSGPETVAAEVVL